MQKITEEGGLLLGPNMRISNVCGCKTGLTCCVGVYTLWWQDED